MIRPRFVIFPRAGRAARAVLTLLASVLLLGATGGGCVRVSHSSVSSVGGEARGAQLDAAADDERVAALAEEVRALGPDVSPDEAALVARVAVHYAQDLADYFDMVRPVELHNVLVNLRLRSGGLCFQMSECMLAELRELPLRTLELRRGIAWKDDLWNEHNCVVVVAAGAPFESGVVLDAWRNAGRLRWAPVRMDHYPWEPKPAPAGEMILASPGRKSRPRGDEQIVEVSRAPEPSADVATGNDDVATTVTGDVTVHPPTRGSNGLQFHR